MRGHMTRGILPTSSRNDFTIKPFCTEVHLSPVCREPVLEWKTACASMFKSQFKLECSEDPCNIPRDLWNIPRNIPQNSPWHSLWSFPQNALLNIPWNIPSDQRGHIWRNQLNIGTCWSEIHDISNKLVKGSQRAIFGEQSSARSEHGKLLGKFPSPGKCSDTW